ncbi:MAG: hypothetical protein ACWGMZ_11045, partial [Thermoguttaceae bacterium]
MNSTNQPQDFLDLCTANAHTPTPEIAEKRIKRPASCSTCRANSKSRRAATLIMAALLMAMMLGMIAFAIDLGYVVLVMGCAGKASRPI